LNVPSYSFSVAGDADVVEVIADDGLRYRGLLRG